MITLYKDWSDAQCIAAYTALKAHSVNQASHPACTPVSFDHVINGILREDFHAVFIDGYLVLFDTGPSWASPEPWLYELLVLKAETRGTFQDYVAGLRQLAVMHNCTGISTGNSVLRPGLRRLYERSGFIPISESFYMEVT